MSTRCRQSTIVVSLWQVLLGKNVTPRKLKDAVAGDLRLRTHQVGTNDPQALLAELLLDSGVLALPPLHGAVVRAISKGGMVIRGTEILSRGGSKARVQTWRQTWWCLVTKEEVLQEAFDLTPMNHF